MKLRYAGQRLEALPFGNKRELEQADRVVFEKVRASIFKEGHPMLAAICEQMSGTVVYGDVTFPHTEETEGSSFGDIYSAFAEDRGTWLVFTGNLEVERSMSVEKGMPVAVLGDVRTPGLVNMQGELFIEGSTMVPGALFFDSGNGGITKLTLVEPAGLIVTQSNVFEIDLRARYYLDPLFNCGFAGAPTTRHEEIIQERFADAAQPPTLVTLDTLADYFTSCGFTNMGARVRGGDYATPLWTLVSKLDSRELVRFLDARPRA